VFGARAVAPETPAAYSVLTWLTFYAPYVRAFEFLMGVALAQVCRAAGSFGKRRCAIAGMILVGVGLASYGLHFAPSNLVAPAFRYDCVAGGLVLLGWSAGQTTVSRSTWNFLPLSAYVLWIWHMFWFNAYVLPDLSAVTSRDAWFIAGRVTILTAFVIVASYGLWDLWRRCTPTWLGSLPYEKEGG
jgi:hypothetical protein